MRFTRFLLLLSLFHLLFVACFLSPSLFLALCGPICLVLTICLCPARSLCIYEVSLVLCIVSGFFKLYLLIVISISFINFISSLLSSFCYQLSPPSCQSIIGIIFSLTFLIHACLSIVPLIHGIVVVVLSSGQIWLLSLKIIFSSIVLVFGSLKSLPSLSPLGLSSAPLLSLRLLGSLCLT